MAVTDIDPRHHANYLGAIELSAADLLAAEAARHPIDEKWSLRKAALFFIVTNAALWAGLVYMARFLF